MSDLSDFLRPNETGAELVARCTSTDAAQFDCSEEAMLWVVMGPRRLPLAKIVPLSALLLALFASGAAGNAAVCAVIATHRAMHTATNYYLFSLAVSDLLLLLFGLPNDLSVLWHQYPYSLGTAFCKLRALISEAGKVISRRSHVYLVDIISHFFRERGLNASYVSVLTIVAFSLERYLAICHPLHLYAMAGLRRALRIVAALWLLALLAASPFALYTTVSLHEYPPGSGNSSQQSAFCGMLEQPSWYLCELSSLLFFILPGVLILGLYVRMGLRIRATHAHKPGALNGVNGSVHGEARQAQSKKTIIRMLAAVVVAFFVCWAPFHFQRLFFIYGTSSPHYHAINEYLFYVAGALYYISPTINPILYNVMSRRYRLAFSETLCCSRREASSASVREIAVTHVAAAHGAHLVRVRSETRDRKNRLGKRSRRNSYYSTETTSLCSDHWRQETPRKLNSVLVTKNSANSTVVLCGSGDDTTLVCNNFKLINDVT